MSACSLFFASVADNPSMDPLSVSRKLALQSPRKGSDGTVVMPKLFDLGTNHSSRPKVRVWVMWEAVSGEMWDTLEALRGH